MDYSSNKIKNIIIGLLALFVVYTVYRNNMTEDVTPVEVTIPEVSGTVQNKIREIQVDTVYISIPGKQTTKVAVDKDYKESYEQALKENDSLKAYNIFLSSIEINNYSKMLIDNDTISISGTAKTRGELIEYSVDYKIKEKKITYIPKVISKSPELSFVYGVSVSFPAKDAGSGEPILGASAGWQNSKGNIYTIGYNTNKNLTIGFSKIIKLRK
jgi:hypothetical protein